HRAFGRRVVTARALARRHLAPVRDRAAAEAGHVRHRRTGREERARVRDEVADRRRGDLLGRLVLGAQVLGRQRVVVAQRERTADQPGELLVAGDDVDVAREVVAARGARLVRDRGRGRAARQRRFEAAGVAREARAAGTAGDVAAQDAGRGERTFGRLEALLAP